MRGWSWKTAFLLARGGTAGRDAGKESGGHSGRGARSTGLRSSSHQSLCVIDSKSDIACAKPKHPITTVILPATGNTALPPSVGCPSVWPHQDFMQMDNQNTEIWLSLVDRKRIMEPNLDDHLATHLFSRCAPRSLFALLFLSCFHALSGLYCLPVSSEASGGPTSSSKPC